MQRKTIDKVLQAIDGASADNRGDDARAETSPKHGPNMAQTWPRGILASFR